MKPAEEWRDDYWDSDLVQYIRQIQADALKEAAKVAEGFTGLEAPAARQLAQQIRELIPKEQ